MKKSQSKRSKNVKSTSTKTGGKKVVKETRKNSSERIKNKSGKGKEKSKPNRTKISNNKNTGKDRRARKDDELQLLNSLFLKELQNDKSKTKSFKTSKSKKLPTKIDTQIKGNDKQKTRLPLRFERKPNKENKRLRGNVFVIIFPPKSTFQQKINLVNNWDGKELKYYVDRFSKLPQAIQVILTTKKGKDTFERATKISPFDFVVSAENTKRFIVEMIVSFQDNYIEYVESEEPLNSDWVYDPSKIIKVTVRFIY